ncbi:uncharacterized lipoprotein YehR (DUF1307 family) [Catenibacillus scindens]|uniref:Uncharacterized lipoprotein YehR (DUF1307 family) n=1 Tax=Catenibacillus scindens TaxID=673271 RepID=A0A7W8H935_9FIRM|nr:hypothetical protein [Catenibacillus scindens]MBB5263420.1 uncharacterized lipoprotein YehR (DUF1307 family) [Catenibacillus scindens]
MKKKSLLGILAVLMVFALALTGCGQQGEQNTGATGSEGQNETVENGDGVVESDNDDITDVVRLWATRQRKMLMVTTSMLLH